MQNENCKLKNENTASDVLHSAFCILHSDRRLPPAARARRGVLILVVLSLLFLFVLIAITYVLVATRQLSASKQFAKIGITGDPPQVELNKAMMQVLRGDAPVVDPATNIEKFHSVIGPHSLLESMYGPYTIQGSMVNWNPNGTPVSADIVEFSLPVTGLTIATPSFAAYNATLPAAQQIQATTFQVDGALEGCVITMTSGPAKGLSSRIVRYEVGKDVVSGAIALPVFHVLAFKGDSGTVVPADPTSTDPQVSNPTFVINGRAFSGTGFGLNLSPPGPYILNAKDGDTNFAPGKEFALLPNPANYILGTTSGNDFYNTTTTQYLPFGGVGGANNDYSAPDYQHMQMAFITDFPGSTYPELTRLPSFHRPDLLHYWLNRARIAYGVGTWQWETDAATYSPTIPTLLEQICLRPNPIDHPQFSGSNPQLQGIVNFDNNIAWQFNPGAPATPPWDVDNNGDGVPDSVWVDLGFPIQTAPDGRLYKPLFAILCEDLDGRLNVNTSGTTEELTPATTHTQTITGAFADGATVGGSIALPRGQGCGPAEVDLTQVGISPADLKNLMCGNYVFLSGVTSTYEGRYGETVAGTAGSGKSNPAPVPNKLAETKRYMYPDNQFNPAAVPPITTPWSGTPVPLSSFGCPSDLWGQSAIGLDYAGQPLWWKPAWTNETQNCPYDLNLSQSGQRTGKTTSSGTDDNPFVMAEMERVLRLWDVDGSMLPQRLNALSGIQALMTTPIPAEERARRITTDSWDPPSPGTMTPAQLRGAATAPPQSLAKILKARLVAHGLSDVQVNMNIRNLLAPELIAGLRMNLNRPMGDGRDNNYNTTPPANISAVDDATPNSYGPPYDNSTVEAAHEGDVGTLSASWAWGAAFGTTVWPAGHVFSLTNGMNVKGPDSAPPHNITVGAQDQLLARQLMARHLYILARLMIDDSQLSGANNHWFDNEPAVAGDVTPYGLKYELSVRRIAQWAINVVDSMSPNNVMTPFEYDLYPFSDKDLKTAVDKDIITPGSGRTWCVDGIVDNGTGSLSPDDGRTWRGLVWGCKPPALLLTETLAFHDRRVADTTVGQTRENSVNRDPDLDQIRIPEGSLFVELYAPHNSNSSQVQSADLYRYTNNQWYLNLDAMAPAGNDGTTASISYPVWRMAISTPQAGTPPPPHSVLSAAPGGLVPPTNSPGFLYSGPGAAPNSAPASASLDTQDPLQNPVATIPLNYKGSLITANTAPANTVVEVERIVWLANSVPQATQLGRSGALGDIFYARKYFNPNPSLADTGFMPAGGYAVVGPREVTAIGSYDSTSSPAAGQKWGYASKQNINLNFLSTGGIRDGAGTLDYPTVGTHIKAPIGIVAAADPPSTWGTGNLSKTAKLGPNVPTSGIGLNVSEPLPKSGWYYQEPTVNNPHSGDGSTAKTDAYGNLNTGVGANDVPFELSSANAKYNANSQRPVQFLPTHLETATTFNYRTVYLQRLANPLAPYHPVTNPYLTVDWLPIDLTVFNGDDNKDNTGGHPAYDGSDGEWDHEDANSLADASPSLVAFASRQRGEYSTNVAGGGGTYTKGNIWSAWPDGSVAPGAADGAAPTPNLLFNLGGENPKYSANTPGLGFNFRHELHSMCGPSPTSPNRTTLGYLNYSYGDPWATSSTPNAPTAYVGSPTGGSPTVVKPFPWLTFNNRPFANPAEVMLVPASSPSRLTFEFSLTDTNPTHNPYDPTNQLNQHAPFSHLLNFFNASTLSPPITPSFDLANILDYLQTASPFVGTETVLNPNTFYWAIPAAGTITGEPNPTTNPGGTEPVGTAGLHPPFNFVSNYRDPGKVNINTIASDTVWNGVLGGAPSTTALGPTFADVERSRRGFDPAGADNYSFNTDPQPRPSIFANPFRSSGGADMVPLNATLTSPLDVDLREKPVNVTLWRADGTKGGATDIDAAGNRVSLILKNLPTSSVNDYNNYTRNAFFDYQPYGQVVNKLTTRSNVYAVWITVGYFEVTPWYGATGTPPAPRTAGAAGAVMTFDVGHPDGYQFGQEMGSDTGEITRHRGFYIIDRTIPVGFQRGNDLNSDKAVVLKRFIE